MYENQYNDAIEQRDSFRQIHTTTMCIAAIALLCILLFVGVVPCLLAFALFFLGLCAAYAAVNRDGWAKVAELMAAGKVKVEVGSNSEIR